MTNYLPPEIQDNAPLVRRTLKIVVGCIAFAAACVIASYAFANKINLPYVARSRVEPTVQVCNPCAHSTPMPVLTATPDIGEPPMVTPEVVR